MKIEHLALWVNNLEKMKHFYTTFLGGSVGELYYNPKKGFSSYFISFNDGCRLELMHKPELETNLNTVSNEFIGLSHFAISVGSKKNVDALTTVMRSAGYNIIGKPRYTGDGYYESVILDPEMNRIEITI